MMKNSDRISKLLCSGFGVGYFSIAPGTIASAYMAAISYLLLLYFGNFALVAFTVLVFCFGLIATDQVLKNEQNKDPSWIVVDELAGQAFVCCYIFSPNLWLLLLAFALFRFFDIVKPWPVGFIDRKTKGAYGVMLDDMAAGIMAALLLLAIQFLWF